MGEFLFAAAAGVLVGLDAYLSHRRMKKYGAIAELNPVARQLAQDFGPRAGVASILAWNTALLGVILANHWDVVLHLLVGAKLGLAAMQLKSLQLETMIDHLLSRKR